MAETLEGCLERAARARAAAGDEPLANARQKHIASAEVWEEMARRMQRLAEGRDRKS